MKLEEIFSDSFEMAKKLVDDFGRFLLLIVFGMIPILDFIVVGYGYKIIRSGKNELPELNNYFDLFISGLKIVVVAIIYFIIPISIIFATLGLGLSFILAPIMFIAISLLFLMAIVAAIGIVHMIVNENLTKAFALGEIMEIISRIGWSKYILWLLVIFAISLFLSAIQSIPYVGWLIVGILSPFYTVFIARASYLIYMEAYD